MALRPSRFTTVLFDLDDTLLDTHARRVAALQSAFDAAGVRRSAEGFIRTMAGQQLAESLQTLPVETGTWHDVFSQYRRAYWHSRAPVRPYQGIADLLRALRARGVRLGVVTQKERVFEVDGRPAGAARELADTRLAGMFEVGVGYEDVTRHKPHPEAVHVALDRLGASPAQALVVGDSLVDIAAARAAGAWSCHATWGRPDAATALDGVKPDAVAPTPDAVLRLVDGV